MSVIVSRALPDVRDGLKPVHRRMLYGMHDMGARPDRPHLKCARVTGDVMGRYHPHGDGAIYDALVRMAQPFSLRHPLVDGHGNFGSLDDGPAAARYTECRLSNIATHLLDGIDQDTVDFEDNYSGEYDGPDRPAGPLPQPAGQRQPGHRRGHGDQHPAAQPGRGHRRHHPPDRPSRRHPRRPDAVRQGPRLPDRRLHPRPPGDHGRLPHRAGLDQDAGQGRDRRDQAGRHVDRGHRAALPGEPAVRAHPDQGAGRLPGARGHPRRQRRLGQGPDPGRDRAEARRQRQRGAQQPVQAHPAADQLRGQHGGAGRRGAPDPQPGPGPARLRRPPGRGHPAPVRVPPPQGPGPGPHRRGPDQGPRHDRRHHRRHPGVGGPPVGHRRPAGGAVRVQRGPGHPHRRHAPVPADPAGPGQPRGGAGQAAPDHRRAGGHPGRRGRAAWGHQDRDDRHPRRVRRRPPGRSSPSTTATCRPRT